MGDNTSRGTVYTPTINDRIKFAIEYLQCYHDGDGSITDHIATVSEAKYNLDEVLIALHKQYFEDNPVVLVQESIKRR